jgi:hypothetical protein
MRLLSKTEKFFFRSLPRFQATLVLVIPIILFIFLVLDYYFFKSAFAKIMEFKIGLVLFLIFYFLAIFFLFTIKKILIIEQEELGGFANRRTSRVLSILGEIHSSIVNGKNCFFWESLKFIGSDKIFIRKSDGVIFYFQNEKDFIIEKMLSYKELRFPMAIEMKFFSDFTIEQTMKIIEKFGEFQMIMASDYLKNLMSEKNISVIYMSNITRILVESSAAWKNFFTENIIESLAYGRDIPKITARLTIIIRDVLKEGLAFCFKETEYPLFSAGLMVNNNSFMTTNTQ